MYYERLTQAAVKSLMKKFDVETLKRWHLYCQECGRAMYKHVGTDRLTIILDLAGIGFSVLTDKKMIGLMKENAHFDQTMYPEHLRKMFLINAPSSFSLAWKLISPMLDERVLKKISVNGKDYQKALFQHVSADQVPNDFGGTGGSWIPLKPKFQPSMVTLRAVNPIGTTSNSVQSGGSLEASNVQRCQDSQLHQSRSSDVGDYSVLPKPMHTTSLRWFAVHGITNEEQAGVGEHVEYESFCPGAKFTWYRNAKNIHHQNSWYEITALDEGQRIGILVTTPNGEREFWESDPCMPPAPSIENMRLQNCAIGSQVDVTYNFCGGIEGYTFLSPIAYYDPHRLYARAFPSQWSVCKSSTPRFYFACPSFPCNDDAQHEGHVHYPYNNVFQLRTLLALLSILKIVLIAYCPCPLFDLTNI